MVDLAASGHTVDDLDWLRNEIGVAHLELDPWGSLIVSPADDDHDTAISVLCAQANDQLALHDLAAGTVVQAESAIDLVVGGQPLRFSLSP